MKAIAQDEYGGPEVLRVGEVPEPRIRDDEVLIRVRAAGVDRGVWHLMTGRPSLLRLGFGLRRPRTRVRGSDVAGTVEAVGAKVTGFRPGDEVYGGTWSGSFAELAVAKPSRLAPKPARLTFEQAATVPVSACTALQLLRDAGGISAGQRVLVTGASGGVGSFAVQLAKAYGAEVTGTAAPSKVDLVAGLGADHVIDYTCGSVADHAPYDLIVDIAGTVPLPELRRALTREGTLVLGGGEGGGRLFGVVGRLLSAKVWPARPRARSLTAFVRARDLETLSGFIDEGKVTPALERVYPFEEAVAALRHLDEGRVRGKIAIAAPRS